MEWLAQPTANTPDVAPGCTRAWQFMSRDNRASPGGCISSLWFPQLAGSGVVLSANPTLESLGRLIEAQHEELDTLLEILGMRVSTDRNTSEVVRLCLLLNQQIKAHFLVEEEVMRGYGADEEMMRVHQSEHRYMLEYFDRVVRMAEADEHRAEVSEMVRETFLPYYNQHRDQTDPGLASLGYQPARAGRGSAGGQQPH
jgi:hemerythrin